MNRNRLLAATLAALMICTALAPMGAAAATVDEEALTVSVSQDDGVIVTVDANETVDNATVDVTTDDENATYAGTGEYTTDADGTVELPEPEEDVTVTVVATVDNATASTTTTLEATADEGASIDVTQDGSDVVVSLTADGEGVANTTVTAAAVDENASYSASETTDENGTATFDAPTGNESIEVSFEATVDGEPVETTATLEPADGDAEPESFGALVSTFVEDAKNDTDGPLGLAVASFVVENNPGNAPDHAGPPSHAGPPTEDDEKKGSQGPPDHAGGPDDGDEDEKKGNGNGGGPPSHAGPSE